ncbi:hypothetical protein BOSP111201_09125 [Bordetella sputigena]
MKVSRFAGIVFLTALMAGCVTTNTTMQALQPVTGGRPGYALGHSPVLAASYSYMLQPLDDAGSILYVQPFGGSATVGVLFGTLGVAANMASINMKTKADVLALHGKVGVDPAAVFGKVATAKGVDIREKDADAAQITPYMYIVKQEDEQLLIASALLIEKGQGDAKWTGKYMYELPLRYSFTQFGSPDEKQTAALRDAMTAGYAKLIDHIRYEDPQRYLQEKRIVFKTPFFAPFANVDTLGQLVDETDDMTWIRTISGVYALRKGDVSIKPQS